MRLLRVSLKWIWILTGNSPQPRRVKWKGGSLRTHKHQTQSEFFMWSKQPERQKHSHVHKKNSLLSPLWDLTRIHKVRKSICQSYIFFFLTLKSKLLIPTPHTLTGCLQRRTTTCIYIMHQFECPPSGGCYSPYWCSSFAEICIRALSRVPVGRFAERWEIGQSEGLTGEGRKSAETARRLQFRMKSAEWFKR